MTKNNENRLLEVHRLDSLPQDQNRDSFNLEKGFSIQGVRVIRTLLKNSQGLPVEQLSGTLTSLYEAEGINLFVYPEDLRHYLSEMIKDGFIHAKGDTVTINPAGVDKLRSIAECAKDATEVARNWRKLI